jgi:hypothetical protein
MTTTIKITCDNAAFTECVGSELARILRECADKVDGLQIEDVQAEHGDHYNSVLHVHDLNGNRVGEMRFE